MKASLLPILIVSICCYMKTFAEESGGVSRTFPISQKVKAYLLNTWGAPSEDRTFDVTAVLTAYGAEFPKNSNATFIPDKSIVIVKNDPKNLAEIDLVLAKMQASPFIPKNISVEEAVAKAKNKEVQPDPRAQEIDWSSEGIRINTKDDEVEIILHSGGTAGRKFIQTKIQGLHDDRWFATLTYQVVQDMSEAYSMHEDFDVTWKINKSEYDKLRAERKLYILRKDDALLQYPEVMAIQKDWTPRDPWDGKRPKHSGGEPISAPNSSPGGGVPKGHHD